MRCDNGGCRHDMNHGFDHDHDFNHDRDFNHDFNHDHQEEFFPFEPFPFEERFEHRRRREFREFPRRNVIIVRPRRPF
jgi:hypothetical protein